MHEPPTSSTRAPRRRRARLTTAAASTAAMVATLVTPLVTATAPAAHAGVSCTLNSSFGRMFPSLSGASFSQTDLSNLAQASMETSHFEPSSYSNLNDEMEHFPAGYTYTGQFLDHDITLDNRPTDLTTPVDPSSLTNGRSPQLDLDSMYAGGPSASPQLYEADGVHLKYGAPLKGAESDPQARDLLRNSATGQAMIGDGRNDENRIVASLHSIMTRFHNRIADDLRMRYPSWSNDQIFQTARQQTTWYYQWAILTDFLPRMTGSSAVRDVVQRVGGQWVTNLRFYDPCNGSMPVEFAGAAYRFGHSMVRDDYEINELFDDLPVFSNSSNPRDNLGGFSPSPYDFAIDWKYFFNLRKNTSPQDAYQLDNSLVPALRLLPFPETAGTTSLLATRNLLRGQQLGLPSGQDVARAMGYAPLRDDQILVGPVLGKGSPQAKPITAISSAFAGKSPLWTYLLAEAAATNFDISGGKVLSDAHEPEKLGPVGSRIVNEVFVGLLKNDPNSVLNHPEFTPDQRFISRTLVDDAGFEEIKVPTGTTWWNPVGIAKFINWGFDGHSGVTTAGSDLTSLAPNQPEGKQVGFIQSTGTMRNTVYLRPGDRMTFKATQRVNWNIGSQWLTVWVDGVQQGGAITPPKLSYGTYSVPVNVTAPGPHYVQIKGGSGLDATAFIDDFDVDSSYASTPIFRFSDIVNVATRLSPLWADETALDTHRVTSVGAQGSSWNFGGVAPYGTSGVRSLWFTNRSGAPINMWGYSTDGAGAGEFKVQPSSTCGTTVRYLNPGQACVINVAFNPYSAGYKWANLWLQNDGAMGPASILMEGNVGVGGLKGTYFKNANFSPTAPPTCILIICIPGAPQPPVVVGKDAPELNTAPGAAPQPGVPGTGNSIRWEGTLVPQQSGQYGIATIVSPGDLTRVWVNGQLVVDNWSAPQPVKEGGYYLNAGQSYSVKVEYSNPSKENQLQLMWRMPGGTRLFDIPTQYLTPNP